METINKGSMQMFKNNIIDLGEVKPNTEHKLVFEIQGDVSKIESVKPSCGCFAKLKIVNNKLVGTYTSESRPLKNKNVEIKEPFLKTIMVTLKDNQPTYLTNDRGVKYLNPNKEHYSLYIKGILVSPV